ncbi:MAG TPA: GlmU family protein [Cyclobacteriaceae bacterium]|jgi:UDP-N-acetylglucosamine diphosphorylase/glucosamine-1-phosphate N-acetyltransferase|nr:GlmU family protein [Cyclobacteriaceae bacterium]
MNLILFDDPTVRIDLLPFTYTRPVAGVRTGILTIAEKWEKWLGTKPSFLTEEYLSKRFSSVFTKDNLMINGAACPDQKLVDAILKLKEGDALYKNHKIIAVRTTDDEIPEVIPGKVIEYPNDIVVIDQVWKIFQHNGDQIKIDFKLLTAGRKSAGISDKHTRTYVEENIFIEEGVTIRAATLNAENGPIYLGKNTIIQEGAIIQGPFALCEGGHVNMGAKIRSNTTVGPYSKVGGEVSNAVIFGYSNKAHDGFLGNSVIGEWCNLGADTNTSNLKNNYDNVKLWSYSKKAYQDTGLMFCGLMMGDHSMCSINTMFNTGTVVGVNANIFGTGFPKNFTPSFIWGGINESETYQLNKAFDTATKAMSRRSAVLTDVHKEILTNIFEATATERNVKK